MSVVIETTIGDLTVDLFTEERPITCLNFIKLCKLKYYNYNLFHTIEQGFIAQTGDPTGVGDGGSSIWGVVEGQQKRFFEAEILPKIYHTTGGLLSLVGAGKNLVGSQFFFTLGENLSSLDGQHCVIGEVVEGHDVLRRLNEAIVDENFRPYQDIRITHTVILEDPFPDPRGFRELSRSPSPSAERMRNGRIAADEDIDDTEGKSIEDVQEMLADREAKARATILEIVGDLPDAEMAPPENVLFVCKLNPVTTDDDLEIIFSRFGKVKSCEVIRDRKTGDSLQYAFVEFEEQRSCEAAYFKMDNVLIDDRRIHVDFSQSVSKLKWNGKGRGVEGDSKNIDFNNLSDKRGRRNDSTERSSTKNKNLNTKNRTDYMGRHIRPSSTRDRNRASSAERRKLREKRHSEYQSQRRNYRSRSRSQSSGKRNRTHSNKSKERQKSRSPNSFNRRETRTRYGRQRDMRSFEKLHNDHYADTKIKDRYASETRKASSQKNYKHKLPEKKEECDSPEAKIKKSKRHGKQKHKKNKMSKHQTSNSDETSSNKGSSESSDSADTRNSNSSANEKRKIKSKKIKKRLKKRKSKKHKK